jgi:hypothetical protein
MSVPIQMTDEERQLLREWNARLTAEGLGMSRGLPPRKVKLTQYIEEHHLSPTDEDEGLSIQYNEYSTDDENGGV